MRSSLSSQNFFEERIGQILTGIAMIFLSSNALVERDLTFDDIKPRFADIPMN